MRNSFFLATVIFFLLCSVSLTNGAGLSVVNLSGEGLEKGDTMSVDVVMEGGDNEVGAFGFEIHYNPTVLAYKEHESGGLVEDFSLFNVVRVENGVLRAGGVGIGNGIIGKGVSGAVVRLVFVVIGAGNGLVQLANLKDDIGEWEAGEAQVSITGGPENLPSVALPAPKREVPAELASRRSKSKTDEAGILSLPNKKRGIQESLKNAPVPDVGLDADNRTHQGPGPKAGQGLNVGGYLFSGMGLIVLFGCLCFILLFLWWLIRRESLEI